MNLYDYQWQNRDENGREYIDGISRPGDYDIDPSPPYKPKPYKPITLHVKKK